MSTSLRLYGDETVKFTYEGERYCVHVRNDECPENPRSWDTPISTMACFHRCYRLGDDIKTSDPEEFWRDLVSEHMMAVDLVDAVRNDEVDSIRIEPIKDDPEHVNLMTRWSFRGDERWGCDVIDNDPYDLSSEILSNLTIYNCQQLLEPYLEWLPLWLYDHSGITMSCGARNYPYNDAWDSGCVGWIIMAKETALKERIGCCDESNWREKAIAYMESEVALYDQYLTGDVYGYTLLKEEDGEWVEQDSCWGFYGDDVMANGISDNVPGLAAAVESNQYETGKATRHVAVSYSF